MPVTRRRFLSLVSAACLMSQTRAALAYRWHGTALGAGAQIILDHPRAEAITQAALDEIARLEAVFSLHQPGSDLSRLNATGRLAAPSFDLLQCLAMAARIHRATEGRFDPTVQPLWQALAEGHATGTTDAGRIARARATIGFDRVRFDTLAVTLDQGQALTLNGIAQGYIADRVADLMRREGVADVLIDTGEIVAMGAPAGQAGWPVTIQGDAQARLLTGRALATSAPLGTVLDAGGTVGHILDPRTGQPAHATLRQVSVSAESAALADGLSTGLCLAENPGVATAILAGVTGARLEGFVPAA